MTNGLALPMITPSSTASWQYRIVRQPSGQQLVREFYEADAEEVLRPIRAFFEQQGIKAEFVHTIGHVGESIAELAQDGRFDLIVMGSRGHSDIGNLVLGSVATKVLAKSSVPVLLIR